MVLVHFLCEDYYREHFNTLAWNINYKNNKEYTSIGHCKICFDHVDEPYELQTGHIQKYNFGGIVKNIGWSCIIKQKCKCKLMLNYSIPMSSCIWWYNAKINIAFIEA